MATKVLEICGKLNIGGAQRVAANIACYAPPGFEICYLVFGDEIGEYEPSILEKGHRVIHLHRTRGSVFAYYRQLIRLMRDERFDVVHCHTMFSSGVAMLAARRAGVPGRITHSHTTKDDTPNTFSRRVYKRIMRFLIRRSGTDFLACGREAGRELYGKTWFDRRGVVIKNGIELSDYAYDARTAAQVRKELDIEGKYVIGHVGHYVPVKNQGFLIRMMPGILEKKPNAVLLMFGEGPERGNLAGLIDGLELRESARLMGNVTDIGRVLSAFDVFAFPSLYEGTPLALIEAQANGAPCVISDRIPDDACLTGLIQKLPLEDRRAWMDAILSAERDPEKDWTVKIEEGYETVEQSMHALYQIFSRYPENPKE